MRSGALHILALAAAFGMGGCVAPVPEPSPEGRTDWRIDFADRQLVRAEQAAQDNRWHDAITVLKSIVAADPGHKAARRMLAEYSRVRAENIASLLAGSRKQIQTGQHSQAQTSLQKVLVLDPNHKVALQQLASMVAKDVRALADSKANEELMARQIRSTGITDAVLSTARQALENKDFDQVVALSVEYPQGQEHPQFRSLLGEALAGVGRGWAAAKSYKQALNFFDQAVGVEPAMAPGLQRDYADVRAAISQQYYTQGLQSLRTNPGAAVDAFTQALKYMPDNAAAKGQLARAKRMQEKLERLGRPDT